MNGRGQVLVAGIGAPDRGDDAAGPVVAERVRARALPGVHVRVLACPLDLLDAWEGYCGVVVVDAALLTVATGARPGPAARTGPCAGTGPAAGTGGGTHGLGLPEVLALAATLGRLPERVAVVGVPVAARDGRNPFALGAALSAPTEAALRAAVDRVAALAAAARAGAAQPLARETDARC